MTTTLQPETGGGLASRQLLEMIAGCAVFQTATGGLSAEDATPFIHEGWYSIEDEPQKTCAVIYPVDLDPVVLAPGLTLPAGNMLLDLWLSMANPDDAAEEERTFKNFHEGIAQVINDYDGAGYLMTARPTQPPARMHPANVPEAEPQAALWFAQYTVKWGPFR